MSVKLVSQATESHHELLIISKLLLDFFADLRIWEFKVLSGCSNVIHQGQVTICNV